MKKRLLAETERSLCHDLFITTRKLEVMEFLETFNQPKKF